MNTRGDVLLQRIIESCFFLLFFLVPLTFAPVTYELFEFNKMMVTYALAIIIFCAWTVRSIRIGKLLLRPTPLDGPLLLFLASQTVSTFLSLDRHVSLWGYYSRFNGGLLSSITYAFLFWAFFNTFRKEQIPKLLFSTLLSAALVSGYGVLERLGIDKHIWVQDVQNRVFSTLGQPNWLASYLSILLPLSLCFSLCAFFPFPEKEKNNSHPFHRSGIPSVLYFFLPLLFYLTLVFTKSRSGFLGFWTAAFLLWVFLFFRNTRRSLRPFLAFLTIVVAIHFFFGTPFSRLNRLTIPSLFSSSSPSQQDSPQIPPPSSILDVGITESGAIRTIVWRGAWDIARHYPFFGSGVETFAFSYYRFRPVAHNMTSEWDFLYNKAHNEYLNYAATTGFIGLGSYLFFIIVFLLWNVRYLLIHWRHPAPDALRIGTIRVPSLFLLVALLSGWLSILVTNFFGFSVVIVQLFFFLLPAIIFSLFLPPHSPSRKQELASPSPFRSILSPLIMLLTVFLLFSLLRYWLADMHFARGYAFSRSSDYVRAYSSFHSAISFRATEPLYTDELSLVAAQLALSLQENGETTASAGLIQESITASDRTIAQSPNNVNFWKTRTRALYALSAIDDRFFAPAVTALETAKTLSPTDAKIRYNLALFYDALEKDEEARAILEEATALKPDYRDAFFALGVFYSEQNEKEKAAAAFEHILQRIDPNDAEAKKHLDDLL